MTVSYSYMLVKAVITLTFVLALLGVTLYALKYYLRRYPSRSGARGVSPVRVLNTFFLGQKKNLTVVEVAGEVLVLGVTPTSVSFLTKLEKSESVDELKKSISSRQRNILSLFN